MSDTEKDVIRKQAQDGMDSLIDPLLESTKELIRILKSRPTKRAIDEGDSPAPKDSSTLPLEGMTQGQWIIKLLPVKENEKNVTTYQYY